MLSLTSLNISRNLKGFLSYYVTERIWLGLAIEMKNIEDRIWRA